MLGMEGSEKDSSMEISDVELSWGGEEPGEDNVTWVAKRKVPCITFLCVETDDWRRQTICEKWRNLNEEVRSFEEDSK
jgi:tRNA threonylcarbamoyladenosine modification (KEOPS) complex Cgi121 subunit